MATYEPQDLDFVDRAPIRIEAEIVVDVDPEALWAVLTDDEAWPEWFGSPLTKVERTSAEQGIGATRRVTLGRGRTALTIDEHFDLWEPPHRWGFTAVSGPRMFRALAERCTIHVEAPGRTRVTYRMAIEPHPLASPLVRAAQPGMRRSLTQALRSMAERAAARRGPNGS